MRRCPAPGPAARSPPSARSAFCDSAEAVDAATATARTWTAANIADLGHLVDDRTGRLGFIAGELAPVPA
jgi:hypothetical protein